MSEIICDVCMHHCRLKDGQLGRCRARRNVNGKNTCDNYGRITSLAYDPIEKKPFARYHPGSVILSVGSYGCNLACMFCQNSSISMADENSVSYETLSAEELAHLAMREEENLGVAFTYNEPLISYEYILDTAECLKGTGKKIVAVTNGSVNRNILEKLFPAVDAMNIDLKGDASFYRELGGEEKTVRDAIEYCCKKCHVEVTTLVVPGKNDSDAFIEEEAKWLASLDPDMVLHLSRYFPRYHCSLPATDVDRILHLQKIAQKYLNFVYTGNV